jgi:hypothetical protein
MINSEKLSLNTLSLEGEGEINSISRKVMLPKQSLEVKEGHFEVRGRHQDYPSRKGAGVKVRMNTTIVIKPRSRRRSFRGTQSWYGGGWRSPNR